MLTDFAVPLYLNRLSLTGGETEKFTGEMEWGMRRMGHVRDVSFAHAGDDKD